MKNNKFKQICLMGIIALVLAGLIMGINGAEAKSSGKAVIGFINSEELQTKLPDYQKLKEKMKDKEAEFGKFRLYLLQQHQNDAKALQEKAAKEKSGKTAKEQTAIDKKYTAEAQKKVNSINKQLEKKKSEIMKLINAEKKKVDQNVKQLISEVAKSKKVTVVLDKGAVWYGGKDLTQDVIKKAQKNAKKK